MQCTLHCRQIPQHRDIQIQIARAVSVRCAWHLAAACRRRCVRAQRHEAVRAVGACVSGDVCAAGCAVKGGGREVGEVRSGEHAATVEERAVL